MFDINSQTKTIFSSFYILASRHDSLDNIHYIIVLQAYPRLAESLISRPARYTIPSPRVQPRLAHWVAACFISQYSHFSCCDLTVLVEIHNGLPRVNTTGPFLNPTQLWAVRGSILRSSALSAAAAVTADRKGRRHGFEERGGGHCTRGNNKLTYPLSVKPNGQNKAKIKGRKRRIQNNIRTS